MELPIENTDQQDCMIQDRGLRVIVDPYGCPYYHLQMWMPKLDPQCWVTVATPSSGAMLARLFTSKSPGPRYKSRRISKDARTLPNLMNNLGEEMLRKPVRTKPQGKRRAKDRSETDQERDDAKHLGWSKTDG